MKDVYEAARSSPRWNETLFIVTYDEHGGFYDHVPPPRVGVPPPGDGEASYPDQFGFDRLGIRIPTLLVSPWVSRGSVVSSPPDAAKPFRTSEFDLTSIMASARELLAESYNIPHLATDVLTERDRWAARFTFALNEPSPRSDCPMHLPDPLPPTALDAAREGDLPINHLQRHMVEVHRHLSGLPDPLRVGSASGHGPHIPVVDRQKHVSPWLQRAFQRHKRRTSEWKSSKAMMQSLLSDGERDPLRRPSSFSREEHHPPPHAPLNLTVMCEPLIGMSSASHAANYSIAAYLASNWTVSLSDGVPFRTVSTLVPRTQNGLVPVAVCLDVLTSAPVVGRGVQVPSGSESIDKPRQAATLAVRDERRVNTSDACFALVLNQRMWCLLAKNNRRAADVPRESGVGSTVGLPGTCRWQSRSR